MQKAIFGAAILCLVLLTCPSQEVWAHRVNIFAYTDGDSIRVECSFSKTNRVRNGKLIFLDRETGAILHEATTDEDGLYVLRPDASFATFLASGHGLVIRLMAGEGHQNEWMMEPAELTGLADLVDPGHVTAPTQKSSPDMTASLPDTESSVPVFVTSLDKKELEALVARVVDARLVPIRHALAGQEEPSFRDIVGGIGWILGLLGLTTYMLYRSKN